MSWKIVEVLWSHLITFVCVLEWIGAAWSVQSQSHCAKGYTIEENPKESTVDLES